MATPVTRVQGNVVDVCSGAIFPGELEIVNGRIHSVRRIVQPPPVFLVPGLVDSHIHIESSMLVPSQFARLALPHGTVACVCDPHEIANVLGLEGVDFMVQDSQQSPLKFFFGAPSCVPATALETSGAVLGVSEIEDLLMRDSIYFLAEMMNVPGVLNEDPEVLAKLLLAKKFGKPVDGHAPLLRGRAAERYAAAGISTDHECVTREEAAEKIGCGMKISIREGSAAKNFDALLDLLPAYPGQTMFCSDDKHPDELVRGHIDQLVRRALKKGKR